LQKARAEWAIAQGKTDIVQTIITTAEPLEPFIASPAVDTPVDASTSDPALAAPIAPIAPATPVIQSVLDAAQAAYNQVVQESIQALSVAK